MRLVFAISGYTLQHTGSRDSRRQYAEQLGNLPVNPEPEYSLIVKEDIPEKIHALMLSKKLLHVARNRHPGEGRGPVLLTN